MSRKPRYHVPGAFYHLMLRGNNGQNIFFDNADRCRLCLLIQEGVERYGHRIHAFCFMSNHIHILVQASHTPLSKIVHNLAFRYSQNVNKRYSKIGHLFQGRFKAILLDEEGYFLKLIRYIHMNPVRAKMTMDPSEYPWSSHKAYLGEDTIAWLTIEHALGKFDAVLDRARKLYINYCLKRESQEDLDEIRMGFKDGQVLGSDDFTANIRSLYQQEKKSSLPLSVIIEAACIVFGVELPLLLSPSQSRQISLIRGAITAHALENGMTLNDIAIVFNRDESTVSRLSSRFQTKYQQSNDLKCQVNLLKDKSRQLASLQARAQ